MPLHNRHDPIAANGTNAVYAVHKPPAVPGKLAKVGYPLDFKRAGDFAAMRLWLCVLIASLIVTYLGRGLIFSGFDLTRWAERRRARQEIRGDALAGVEWGAIFWGLFVWFAISVVLIAIHVPWFFALFIGFVLGVMASRRAL